MYIWMIWHGKNRIGLKLNRVYGCSIKAKSQNNSNISYTASEDGNNTNINAYLITKRWRGLWS